MRDGDLKSVSDSFGSHRENNTRFVITLSIFCKQKPSELKKFAMCQLKKCQNLHHTLKKSKKVKIVVVGFVIILDLRG